MVRVAGEIIYQSEEYMRILVSNDDGVYAAGITVLAHEMAKLGEVIVVAPDHYESFVWIMGFTALRGHPLIACTWP